MFRVLIKMDLLQKYAGSSWCTVKIKMERREGRVPKRQSFFKTMLYIPIYFTYCLFKNYVFSLIMAGGTILALATYPTETMKQILSGTFGAVLFLH